MFQRLVNKNFDRERYIYIEREFGRNVAQKGGIKLCLRKWKYRESCKLNTHTFWNVLFNRTVLKKTGDVTSTVTSQNKVFFAEKLTHFFFLFCFHFFYFVWDIFFILFRFIFVFCFVFLFCFRFFFLFFFILFWVFFLFFSPSILKKRLLRHFMWNFIKLVWELLAVIAISCFNLKCSPFSTWQRLQECSYFSFRKQKHVKSMLANTTGGKNEKQVTNISAILSVASEREWKKI